MSDQYDRVLIRLSSAEDEKLDPILEKLLPLIFDELLTQSDAAARAKIVNVLNHALTRVKGNPKIKLPVKGIAERWFSPNLATSANAPFFRNLSIIFLDMGVPRLSPVDQIDVALYALEHFGELRLAQDRPAAFLTSIAGLGQIAAEGLRQQQVSRCLAAIAARGASDAGVSAFFQTASDFLFIPCNAAQAPSVAGLGSASWNHWKPRLKAKTPADMIALKTSVLKWLGSLGAGAPASLVYVPSLSGVIENYEAVSTLAEGNCKRLDPELDLAGDVALVGRLVCCCLSSAPPGLEEAAPAPHLQVEPKSSVPSKLRQKVASLLQRSQAVGKAALVPHVVHLVRQCLRDSAQVQIAALQLALVVAETCDPAVLIDTSTTMLQEVEAVFFADGGVVLTTPATPLAFKVYGSFARQLAERPTGAGRAVALRGAPKMLSLLAMNEGSAQDILEALSGLVACMAGTTEVEYQQFVPLLDKLITSQKPIVRREVLRWSTTLFPTSAPEGRYYALRLFSDPDADIARSAENALSAGGRDVPRFASMCSFLALRALDLGPGAGIDRLDSHASVLAAAPGSAALPGLSSGFSPQDVARSLAFLLKLAEASGTRLAADDGPPFDDAVEPLPKRLCLAAGTSAAAAGSPAILADPLVAFVALLDYILAEVVEGKAAAMTEAGIDGSTHVEVGLRGLLLAAALAGPNPALLSQVLRRAELVLLGQGLASGVGTLFREGGSAAGRARRLGARILGSLSEKLPAEDPGSPLEAWLGLLEQALAPGGAGAAEGGGQGARRAGAALAACELLRSSPRPDQPARGLALCRMVIGLLLDGSEKDSAVLSAACEGLRRLSERRRLVWEVLEGSDGTSGAPSGGKPLLEALSRLSDTVTGGLGDTLENELGAASRDLVHCSWRLLGQLAAYREEGSSECIDRLIAIGKRCPGEEATAALGMALAAAATEPPETKQAAAASSEHGPALLQRVLDMALGPSSDGKQQEDGKADTEKAAPETGTERRSGVVWLVVLLRRLLRHGRCSEWARQSVEPLCRVFVQSVGGISIFAADCGIKGLCHLYALVPPEGRQEMLRTLFGLISNRTSVSNMFVGTPDTQARKDEKDVAAAAGPNSLKIAAKERVDLLKDLMFLARELQHPPLFIALLDQPVSSVWTGDVLVEALDLQSACLPDEMQAQLCPAAVRPKLYPFFFHPNGPLRQAVIAVTANYFACESPQHLASKFPEEWPIIARSLVNTLGSARVATREASVHAAQALFRGKAWPEVKPIFEDFWGIVVKLMDDMEPKIQAVMGPLVRMMRNLIVRLVDAKCSPRKDVEDVLPVLVPLLLQSCERYKHAQPLCFDIIRELVKVSHGTQLMSPYVQDLVPPLLVSLSMLEHDSLSYYQSHVSAKSEEKGKELESARISNSRDSQSMKLLRQLVPLITAENAEALAPRTRDSLHRGVGANTRVGACDFWVAVCSERPSAVPSGGAVASSMFRSVAGALLDPSAPVRDAAASCFASLAKRNSPQELTAVVFDRLLRKDQDYRTDETQRNAYRLSLARALWEVSRRCGDEVLEVELRAAIAAKAFGLRWSNETEVKSAWESLWNEVCPSTSGGISKYYKPICGELSTAFEDSVSRAEKVNNAKALSALCAQLEKTTPRPKWSKDPALLGLHAAVLGAVRSLPVFEGSGLLVQALADLAALLHRRPGRKEGGGGGGGEEEEAVPEESATGLPLVLSFCSKGSLLDRAAAVRALQSLTSAVRLWGPLEDVEKLHQATGKHVDHLQKEVEAEEREPGEPVPKRHRGKGQSPAEELLTATLDFWATTLQQCRKEVEDEGDLDPPEPEELSAFFNAALAEFIGGSLTLRLAVIRFLKHVLVHLAEEKLPVCARIGDDIAGRFVAAVQDASLDGRSERLRRPALDLAGCLVKDAAAGGGRELLRRGLSGSAAAAGAMEDVKDAGSSTSAALHAIPLSTWLGKLDPITADLEAEAVAALRSLESS